MLQCRRCRHLLYFAVQCDEAFDVFIIKIGEILHRCRETVDHANFDDYRLRQPIDGTVALKLHYCLDGTVATAIIITE